MFPFSTRLENQRIHSFGTLNRVVVDSRIFHDSQYKRGRLMVQRDAKHNSMGLTLRAREMSSRMSKSMFEAHSATKATWAPRTNCRSKLTNLGISWCVINKIDGMLAPRYIFEFEVLFRRSVTEWRARSQRLGPPNARLAKSLGRHAGMGHLLPLRHEAPGTRHNAPLLDVGPSLLRRAPLTPQIRCNLEWPVEVLAMQLILAPLTKMYVKLLVRTQRHLSPPPEG